jgi:hypothetical protein
MNRFHGRQFQESLHGNPKFLKYYLFAYRLKDNHVNVSPNRCARTGVRMRKTAWGHPVAAKCRRITELAYDSRHGNWGRASYLFHWRNGQYCPWCLVDIRVPIHWRWYNSGKGVFRYGLLDEEWQEKRVFNVVREEIALLKRRFARKKENRHG